MGTVRDLVEPRRAEGAGVVTIGPDASVFDAARLMNEHRIGALVVIDGKGAVIGIFTERDVLQRVVAAGRSPQSTRIKEVMTEDVIVCQPETRCDDVRTLMKSKRIRHVPIVADGGELIGMVSIGDLNMAEVKDLSDTVGYLSEYMTRL